MRKVISAIFLVISMVVYAAAEPVISVNGAAGSSDIYSDTPVTLSVKLSPGDTEGKDADWWLLAYGSGRWYYHQLNHTWMDLGAKLDLEKLRPSYQGKLFTFNPTDIGRIPKLAIGNYALYFGIDLKKNGKPDWDSLIFKTVNITLSDSGERLQTAAAYKFILPAVSDLSAKLSMAIQLIVF